jgi:hypothetical protein
MDKTLGDSLDQTQSIVQAKDGGYVTAGWSQSNMSGDKTISGRQDFWVVTPNVLSKSLGSQAFLQFVRVIPYNFLHQWN